MIAKTLTMAASRGIIQIDAIHAEPPQFNELIYAGTTLSRHDG